jgi:hypothetical protein
MNNKTYLTVVWSKMPVFAVIFALAITINVASAAEIASGPMYSVIELTFSGPSISPSDAPSRDVDFWARFQHESGSPTYKIHGFWDGNGNGGMSGNVFRIRFCPTKAGRWNIVEVFSNKPELNGEKQGDHITVSTSSLHGFWEVDSQSAGGRWYRRSDGSHQYIVGNTMYSFISEMYTDNKPNGSDIAKDIRGNAQYFKKVRFSAIGDRYPHPTDRPFLNSSGSPTNNGDDSHRPNPQWFHKRVDLAVKTAFDHDLIADLIMAAVDVDELRASILAKNNNGDVGPFFKYLVARYGSYPNVWFCLINEGDHGNKNPHFSPSELRAFGIKAKSYMAYPSPLSVHLRAGWSSGLNGPWNDHVIFQSKLKNISSSADAIKSNYSSGGSNKPVVNDELSYQGSGDGHSEGDTIESHLGAFLGGGYGTTGYKSGNKLGQYFAGNFNASSHSSADNLLYLRQKIDSDITFWRLSPTSSSALSGGVRSLAWEGNEYVTGTNGGGTVTANLPSGTWTIKVWDIFAKSEKVISTSATGKVSISAPSSRAGLIHAKRNGSSPTPNPDSITLTLKTGWNLISLPVANSTPVETVLAGIAGKYQALYAFDTAANTYKTYIPGAQGNTFDTINNGVGYWIYMSENASLKLDQVKIGEPVQLVVGWNLVGYTGKNAMEISSALESIEGKYSVVYGYDGSAYKAHIPGSGGELKNMQAGEGFWIYATQNATWDID